MSGKHGHRRRPPRKGMASGCQCSAKGSCFTTLKAANAAVARVPDAIRAYRGSCCGHYHITRYTVDEFAQRVAAYDDAARPERRDLTGIHHVVHAMEGTT